VEGLEVGFVDGSFDVLTGAPNHPFWASRGGSEGT